MARPISHRPRRHAPPPEGRRGARALAHALVASALEPVLAAPPPPNLPRELVAPFEEERRRLIGRAAPELIEPAPKPIEATPMPIEPDADPDAAEPSMPK